MIDCIWVRLFFCMFLWFRPAPYVRSNWNRQRWAVVSSSCLSKLNCARLLFKRPGFNVWSAARSASIQCNKTHSLDCWIVTVCSVRSQQCRHVTNILHGQGPRRRTSSTLFWALKGSLQSTIKLTYTKLQHNAAKLKRCVGLIPSCMS